MNLPGYIPAKRQKKYGNKGGLALIAILVAGLMSCSHLPQRASLIVWPEKIDYLQALCDLDMAWKGMRYSGTMSLTVEYPEGVLLEVYGPFGETVLYVKRNGSGFLLVADNERITDERRFEEKFGIRLSEFVEDITLRGLTRDPWETETIVTRERYTVTYGPGDGANRICWSGNDGRICITFLEARFDKSGE